MTSKLTINDDTAGISAADEAVGVSTELLAMIAVVGALLCLCMLLGIVGCRAQAPPCEGTEKAEEKAARASINDILMNELLADGGDDEGDMVSQGNSFGVPVPRVAWAGVRATESLDHGAAASVRVASAGDRVYSLRALPSAASDAHWEREMAEVAALHPAPPRQPPSPSPTSGPENGARVGGAVRGRAELARGRRPRAALLAYDGLRGALDLRLSSSGRAAHVRGAGTTGSRCGDSERPRRRASRSARRARPSGAVTRRGGARRPLGFREAC